MSNFPVTAKDEVYPTHPKDEPTREEVNKRDVDTTTFMLRTRRYFRITHQDRQLHYAKGLDTNPKDMA